MKCLLRLGVVTFVLVGLAACKSHRDIGWYRIADYPDNSIVGNLLFGKADFTDIYLDTMPDFGLPYIQCRIIPEKRKEWSDITELLIGKRLGFVYNDSVIMAPVINARIESGSFEIVNKDKRLLNSIYKTLHGSM